MASIEALLGVLRASDYGARGGGNRDDAPGIIQALAVAAVAGGAAPLSEGQNLTGGIVTLDAGVLYRIGRTVNIPSNVELVIPTGALVRAAPGLVGAMFAATGAVGMRVTGGGLVDGNRAGGAQADPFVFTNCSDGNLDGPIVQGGNTDGVTLTGCTRMQLEIQSQANGRHGVYHSGSTFCGGTILARDNGQRVAGSGLAFDVASTDSSYQLLATDTRAGGAKTQQYGFFEVPASGCDRNVLSASSLTGNALGTQAVVGGASGYVAGAPAVGTVTDATVAAGGLSNAALGAGVARANHSVNGLLNIWQRTIQAYTASGGPAGPDRLLLTLAGTDTISATQDTANADTANGAAFDLACAFVLGTGAGGSYVWERFALTTDLFRFFRSRQVTRSWRVRASVANAVRLAVTTDGTGGGTTFGAFHTGDGTYQTLSVTSPVVPADATFVRFEVRFAASATINVGAHATVLGAVAADPYAVAIDAADDLVRCKRYYKVFGGLGASSSLTVSGNAGLAADTLSQFVGFDIEMAAVPTVTKNGTWALANASVQPTIGAKIDTKGFRVGLSSTAAGQFSAQPDTTDDTITCEANP